MVCKDDCSPEVSFGGRFSASLGEVKFLSNRLSQHSTSSSGLLPCADMSELRTPKCACSNSPRQSPCRPCGSSEGFIIPHTGRMKLHRVVEWIHTAWGDTKGLRDSWLQQQATPACSFLLTSLLCRPSVTWLGPGSGGHQSVCCNRLP
jgi:hypothetical protein